MILVWFIFTVLPFVALVFWLIKLYSDHQKWKRGFAERQKSYEFWFRQCQMSERRMILSLGESEPEYQKAKAAHLLNLDRYAKEVLGWK